MSNIESFLKKCDCVIEDSLKQQLRDIASRIETIEESQNIDEIKEFLSYANSVLRFVCCEDTELYEEYRYRLFLTEKGRLILIQGLELDID